jgi:hypothetical protein
MRAQAAEYHECGAPTTKGYPCKRKVPPQHKHCTTHADVLEAPKPKDAERAERKRRAFQMRRAGLTFQEIADQLGYTDRGSARLLVREALLDIAPDPDSVREMRALERSRLERMLAAVMPSATAQSPDLDAVDRAVRIVNSLIKLDGLAAPARVEHSGPAGGPIELDFAALSVDDRRAWMRAIAAEASRRVEIPATRVD